MKGIELLRSRNIDFHVIAVVTSDALEHPDEIFDFFLELGIRRLGFNVEGAMEGENRTSSLIDRRLETRIRSFWTRLFERQQQAGGVVQIREFEIAYRSIVKAPQPLTAEVSMRRSSQVAPFGIVSMDWQGNLTSFSPELVGMKSIHYGDFNFGNILRGDLLDLRRVPKFQRVANDIYAGVKRCERSCEYFSLCGGGAPSNKYFENGSFDSAETMYCRTSIQMPIDIVLADLETQLGLAPHTIAATPVWEWSAARITEDVTAGNLFAGNIHHLGSTAGRYNLSPISYLGFASVL